MFVAGSLLHPTTSAENYRTMRGERERDDKIDQSYWKSKCGKQFDSLISNYHVSGCSEANSHPAQSLSLHVDIENAIITNVGVNSNKTGAV